MLEPWNLTASQSCFHDDMISEKPKRRGCGRGLRTGITLQNLHIKCSQTLCVGHVGKKGPSRNETVTVGVKFPQHIAFLPAVPLEKDGQK